MSRLCALLLLFAAFATVEAAARQPSDLPARRAGHVYLGVLGDPARFQHLTGQRSDTRHLIVSWGQGLSSGATFQALFGTMGRLPMLGMSTGTVITPLQIARGVGDVYLVALNHAVHGWGAPIYIRPMGEMNGHWNAYCAYNADGTPRGPAYSTAAFKKAFARIYLIVHGSSSIDSRLARLGLPRLRYAVDPNPFARVIWNPQGYGSPDVPGNRAQAYYPGDAYVDVVGDDLYYIRGKAEWAAAEALYRAHPGKPFSFPEWALWGIDEPSFIEEMARFVRTHPRTEMISYYLGAPGGVFDLASKPRSRATYRQVIVPLGT